MAQVLNKLEPIKEEAYRCPAVDERTGIKCNRLILGTYEEALAHVQTSFDIPLPIGFVYRDEPHTIVLLDRLRLHTSTCLALNHTYDQDIIKLKDSEDQLSYLVGIKRNSRSVKRELLEGSLSMLSEKDFQDFQAYFESLKQDEEFKLEYRQYDLNFELIRTTPEINQSLSQ
ncbi:hypothetical protein CMI42_05435 [Candidatus Pacearchaeota archaeon]|nr:hypothetical protein [Candidatus Pacearchaeota archaeon]|tara:strand:+ start:431 stop:946 length:516 start_codon:yes stop_codon:yes gene_type:complete